MARGWSILDTNVLIRAWRRGRQDSPSRLDGAEVATWAEGVVRLYRTDRIVTPVAIEFVAGARDAGEVRLGNLFLARFRAIDGGSIHAEDWILARRLAERVPRDGRPRQFADCLIRAIARRLKHDVISLDTGFPR